MFLLTAIIIALCCWKVPCFREGTFAIFKRIHSALYVMCTTEQFRLKQDKVHLTKKLKKQHKELEEIRELKEKQEKIVRQLPDTPAELASASPPTPPHGTPSAPPCEGNEKNLGRSGVHLSRTKVDFHKEDRYSGNPRRPKDGSITKAGNIN